MSTIWSICATAPVPATCAPCYVTASTTILTYPTPIEFTTFELIPLVTVFPNGSLSTTSYRTYLDGVPQTYSYNFTDTLTNPAGVTVTAEDQLTWMVDNVTLTYPTVYIQYETFDGAFSSSYHGPTSTSALSATSATPSPPVTFFPTITCASPVGQQKFTVTLPASYSTSSLIVPWSIATPLQELDGPSTILPQAISYLDTLPTVVSQFDNIPLQSCLPWPDSGTSFEIQCVWGVLTNVTVCGNITQSIASSSAVSRSAAPSGCSYKLTTLTYSYNTSAVSTATTYSPPPVFLTYTTASVLTTTYGSGITDGLSNLKSSSALALPLIDAKSSATASPLPSVDASSTESQNPPPSPAQNSGPNTPQSTVTATPPGTTSPAASLSSTAANTPIPSPNVVSTAPVGPQTTSTPDVITPGQAASIGSSAIVSAVGSSGLAVPVSTVIPVSSGAATTVPIGGTSPVTISASGSNVIVGDQTIAPGSTAVVNGQTVAQASGGSGIVVLGPTTVTPGNAQVTALPLATSVAITASLSGSNIVVAGITLSPGSAAIINGQVVSEPTDGQKLVIDKSGSSQTTIAVGSQATVIPVGLVTSVPISITGSALVVAGSTLTPGGTITYAGNTISLDASALTAYINSTPVPLSGNFITIGGTTYNVSPTTTGGVGGYVVSGLGGAPSTGARYTGLAHHTEASMNSAFGLGALMILILWL